MLDGSGRYLPPGSVSNTACQQCSPGTFALDPADASLPCVACSPGFFTEHSGALRCTQCPVGTSTANSDYVRYKNMTHVHECPSANREASCYDVRCGTPGKTVQYAERSSGCSETPYCAQVDEIHAVGCCAPCAEAVALARDAAAVLCQPPASGAGI